MKLSHLLTLTSLMFSGIVAHNLHAAPTQLQQAHTQKTISTEIHQDENELTNVKINIDGESQQYTFTPAEIQDTEGLKQKLADLDEKQRKALIATLQSVPHRGQYKHIITAPTLTPEMKLKLRDLKQQMADKEAKMAVIVKRFESDAQAMENQSAAMEAKAREIEVHFEQHGDQLHQQIEVISDEMVELAEQIVEIEVGDLDIDIQDLKADKVLVYHSDKHQIDKQQLLDIISHADISDAQKQQIQQLLDSDD